MWQYLLWATSEWEAGPSVLNLLNVQFDKFLSASCPGYKTIALWSDFAIAQGEAYEGNCSSSSANQYFHYTKEQIAAWFLCGKWFFRFYPYLHMNLILDRAVNFHFQTHKVKLGKELGVLLDAKLTTSQQNALVAENTSASQAVLERLLPAGQGRQAFPSAQHGGNALGEPGKREA